MRPKAPDLNEQQRLALAEDYRLAAMEDLGTLEVLFRHGFLYPHNACMHIARASEKMMKSKLLLRGTNPDWIHDQVELMLMLGFSEDDPLMHTAALFSTFAVNSNYPSAIRNNITSETANGSYDDLFEILDAVCGLEPKTEVPSKPRHRRLGLLSYRK